MAQAAAGAAEAAGAQQGGAAMDKVYGVRELELKPGVSEVEFERFVREEWSKAPPFPGLRLRVLKGQRGARTGKYLWLWEWESYARWREAFPEEREDPAEAQRSSDEVRQWSEAHQAAVGKRFQALAEVPGGVHTSYREVVTLGE